MPLLTIDTDGSENGLSVATKINAAINQIGLNQTDIANEVANRTSAVAAEEAARIAFDDAIKIELDATQTGAGLTATGDYLAAVGIANRIYFFEMSQFNLFLAKELSRGLKTSRFTPLGIMSTFLSRAMWFFIFSDLTIILDQNNFKFIFINNLQNLFI